MNQRRFGGDAGVAAGRAGVAREGVSGARPVRPVRAARTDARWRPALAAAACAMAAAVAGCGGGGDDGGGNALPAVAPRTCGATNGPAHGGVDVFGSGSYAGLSRTPGTTGTVTFDPGEVGFSDPAQSASALSGSLRVTLWASTGSYTGGTLSGHIVARSALTFTGGTNQLRNGQRSDVPATTLAATSPPRGSYCMVITLEEYGPSRCASSDGYCIADWVQFASSAEFQ
ncbi:MAG: hypothetical protein JNL85_11130 [Rubrivivax sp.]|nr:hypothetical protein [Rubrivivax sp.]